MLKEVDKFLKENFEISLETYFRLTDSKLKNICKIYDGHKLLINLCYRNDEYIKIWIDGYMEGRKKWW